MGYPPQDKVLSKEQKNFIIVILLAYFSNKKLTSDIEEIIEILKD